jgi:APA family basic amino acid/polyamine antiporter
MMGRFQIVLTALKVAVVASILVLGLTARTESHPTAVAHFPAHAPIVAFLTALVPVMAAYNGFQSLGALGGELVEPRRNLPRAVICGTSLVVVLFILINWVYFRILTFSEVAQSQHVASDAVSRLLGQAGARYFTVAMIISALGSLHSGFLTGPRITYAMARDSKFFAFAGRLQPRFRTPSGALLLQGCMTILLVMTGTHEELYSYAMFATWTFLAFTPIALIRLRCAEPNLQRPCRVWAYPWTPAIFGVAATAISINLWLLRPVRSSIGLAIILSGLWFFYRWRSPQTDRSEGMRYGVRTSSRATDAA